MYCKQTEEWKLRRDLRMRLKTFILHVVTRMATTEANQKPVETLDEKITFLKVHKEKEKQ